MRSPIPGFLRVGEHVPIGTKVRMLPMPWWKIGYDWAYYASEILEVINAHDVYWRCPNCFSLRPDRTGQRIEGESEWVTVRWIDRIMEDSFVARRSHCYRIGEWYVEKQDDSKTGFCLHTVDAPERVEV